MICRYQPNDACWRWVDDGQHPCRLLCGAQMRSPAAGAAVFLVMVPILMVLALLMAATPAAGRVADKPCPPGAIAVEPGASIQAAVDRAGDGTAFCLKNGFHRMQAIRPKPGQSFYGEGQTVLNGSRLLTTFSREGRDWVASGQEQRGRKHGECAKEVPACSLPEGLFIDDKPLAQVLTRQGIEAGQFYFDHAGGRIYFADD